jgi:hypothetical protein
LDEFTITSIITFHSDKRSKCFIYFESASNTAIFGPPSKIHTRASRLGV